MNNVAKKLDKETVIKRLYSNFGDKYDFSDFANNIKYQNTNQKITYICKKHGLKNGYLNNLLAGHGCKECMYEALHEKYLKKSEDFVKQANIVHENKYDYSKVKYNGSKEKVEIICKTCSNSFFQSPLHHLSGEGCPFCNGNTKLTKEDVVERSNKIHNNKYDYSLFLNEKFNFKNRSAKIPIICHSEFKNGIEHGIFFQMAKNHYQGKGCPKCNYSHLEEEIEVCLTENSIKFERQKKFNWLGLKSLDFYLPDYNIAIECQGEQHYKPIKWFGGDVALKKQIDRDSEKFNKCKEHGIELIYYSNIANDNIFTNKKELINFIIKNN